jgi:hypothetical protein
MSTYRTGAAVALLAVLTTLMVGLCASSAFAASKDSNHNGIPNWWESKYHLSKTRNQAKSDFDKDGLNSLNEYRAGTNPRKKDSDGDGVRDGNEDSDRDGLPNLAEVRAHTSLRSADTDHDGVRDRDEDPDRDGLDNEDEWVSGTNPRVADTDHDGVGDADEDEDHDGLDNESETARGTDPRDSDSDHDGVDDDEEVGGIVASFDAASGLLTLRTFGRDAATVTVSVDASTAIAWDDQDDENEDGDEGDGARANATLADLVPGVIVEEAETTGTAPPLYAVKIELKRPEREHEAIATVRSFDASTGVLQLEAEEDDDLEFSVVVNSSTVLEWADGVTTGSAPTAADLLPETRITALVTETAPDGTLIATRIALRPHSGEFDGGEHDD